MTAYGFRCPVDPAHGKLRDWPTERWAFHCSHQGHDPFRGRPATRSFFTTTEAETGLLIPAPLTPARALPPRVGRGGKP